MNFTFTWILDKFGFQAKPTFEITKTVAPKATTVAKKVARKTAKIPKATTRKTPKK
jgi:hypothetical protein